MATSRDDDGFDIPPVADRWLWRRVAGQVAFAGALAGGFEAVGLSLTVRLSLTAAESAVLAGMCLAADAALGAAFGVVGGILAQAAPRMVRWRRYRLGFTIGVLLLVAFFLAPLGQELWLRGQRNGALGMLGLGASVGILAWYNAGFWYRRELIGVAPRLAWKGASSLVAAALGLVSLALDPSRPAVADRPPADAPNVLLLTVDTLRRDHVGAFGSLVNTPRMDALAREGVAFDGAITPLPETAPSHATMFTGLAPVQHGVVANGMVLPTGLVTLADQLALGGWRTGAFVSAYAVDSSTGLDQGFGVYDDDFLPAGRGLSEIRAARLLLRVLLRFGDPADFPALLERAAPATIERALQWAGTPGPSFLWVHLFEPHAPYERHDGVASDVDHRDILGQEPGYPYAAAEEDELRALYREEVEYTDAQVGVLLDGLRAKGFLDRAVVLLVADHGESLGEHGIRFNHHGLYDEVVRVPLIAWSSPARWPAGSRIARQVTVGDVANTLLDGAGMGLLANTDSMPLGTLASGAEVPPNPVLLLGRTGRSLREGQLFGVRTPAGVKYIQSAEREELYDLAEDPGELRDIAAEQPAAVASGRANVAILLSRMPEVPEEVAEQLRALGYR